MEGKKKQRPTKFDENDTREQQKYNTVSYDPYSVVSCDFSRLFTPRQTSRIAHHRTLGIGAGRTPRYARVRFDPFGRRSSRDGFSRKRKTNFLYCAASSLVTTRRTRTRGHGRATNLTNLARTHTRGKPQNESPPHGVSLRARRILLT